MTRLWWGVRLFLFKLFNPISFHEKNFNYFPVNTCCSFSGCSGTDTEDLQGKFSTKKTEKLVVGQGTYVGRTNTLIYGAEVPIASFFYHPIVGDQFQLEQHRL